MWRPRTGCALRAYNGAAACELLKHVGRVVVIGESLERMLVKGLLNVQSDDFEAGSLPANQTDHFY